MPVGNGGDGVQIGNVAVGIAQSFQIDGLGVGLNGRFHLSQVVGVHKRGGDAELRQRVGQQVIASAVDGLLSHNVIAGLGQGLNGIGDGRGAGGGGQGGASALQGRNALFQNVLGGVGQPAVNVAGVLKAEAGGRVGGVAEYIAGGLINGDGPGIRCGVGLLLAHMQLQRFKMISAHNSLLTF